MMMGTHNHTLVGSFAYQQIKNIVHPIPGSIIKPDCLTRRVLSTTRQLAKLFNPEIRVLQILQSPRWHTAPKSRFPNLKKVKPVLRNYSSPSVVSRVLSLKYLNCNSRQNYIEFQQDQQLWSPLYSDVMRKYGDTKSDRLPITVF